MYPISSIWIICKKIVSNDSEILLTRTRIGMGSLQVRIDGFGRRTSAETRGESAASRRDALETFEKRDFVRDWLGALTNWCWRLA